MPNPNDYLEEVKDALGKMTPGPWSQDFEPESFPLSYFKKDDAEAIVLLRNLAPRMVRELEAYRRYADRVEADEANIGHHESEPPNCGTCTAFQILDRELDEISKE